MESGSTEPRPPSRADKKRLNRAPSPARPFLRDRSTLLPPKSPAPTPGRLSRRGTPAKDKPLPARGKATPPGKRGAPSTGRRDPPSSPITTAGRRPGPPGGTLRVTHTDSSSDLSDCPSEPLSDEHRPLPPTLPAHSSDNESASSTVLSAPPEIGVLVGAGKDDGRGAGKRSAPQGPGQEEELLRELDELRSENDYLKVGPCTPIISYLTIYVFLIAHLFSVHISTLCKSHAMRFHTYR